MMHGCPCTNFRSTEDFSIPKSNFNYNSFASIVEFELVSNAYILICYFQALTFAIIGGQEGIST